MTELVSIDAVAPSTYNPRQADEQRLALVGLSLRKLGFLLPMYATPDGEILSGHQRHLVAGRLGWDAVPLDRVKPLPLERRRALNILFNRATNDLRQNTTPADMTRELLGREVERMAARLPDKVGDGRYPCLGAVELPIKELIGANAGRWVDYARNVSRVLTRRYGVSMPIVARHDGTVINGIGRLAFLSEMRSATAPVVFVTDDEAAFAETMLNYLSMDFDIHTRYADVLRYNSFRRASTEAFRHAAQNRGASLTLAQGFIWPLSKQKIESVDLEMSNSDNQAAWKRRFGTSVLDFGAGRLFDVAVLRRMGVDATPFEPYCLAPNSNDIDLEASRLLTRQFLEIVASGKRWSSIFLSAVLNSVPFDADRRHILAIVAALCSPATEVFLLTSAIERSNFRHRSTASVQTARNNGGAVFLLGYEPGVTLGGLESKPKMQKFFAVQEFRELLSEFFELVTADNRRHVGTVNAVCKKPRGLNRQRLRRALEFEFDLPYPEGGRMGLVEEAVAAFSERLGVVL